MKIKNLNLEKYIEHTLLKPDATLQEIKNLLDDAVKYGFFGVCINPLYVSFAKEYLKTNSVRIITVIGFPLGTNRSDTKEFETEKALEDGADEFDMVIDIGAIKEKNYSRAKNNIKKVVEKAGEKIVKVILETDLLTKDEMVEACKISAESGAKFVKTSTGFVKNGVGATFENVKLMYDTVFLYGVKVKASGGIKDRNKAVNMIEAGAARIGTSSGVNIINL
ncbi:MAG: deoxyribose-phosphate aldolase [bacterium]